jgi:hypothetical protein
MISCPWTSILHLADLITCKYVLFTRQGKLKESLPLWQQMRSVFPLVRFNFAKFTAEGRLLKTEKRSNFDVWPVKAKVSTIVFKYERKKKKHYHFSSFILTTIGICKYASASGRQSEIDSRSQFNMQSTLHTFAAVPKNIK